METIRISGTDESPEIILDKNESIFKFTGKSLPEDVKEFYNPIHKWIEEYSQKPNEETVVEFDMEYFNSASSKQILDILEQFATILKSGKKVVVVWHYLADDEDMEDAGESYADIVDVPFKLVSH